MISIRPEMRVHAANNIREMGIEGVVVIGGDGSYHGAMGLCELGILRGSPARLTTTSPIPR